MLDLAGFSLTATEREVLAHPQVGGVILFSRNYQDLAQVRALIHDIRQASHTRLLIAVDHEGGRVQRFRKGFFPLPPLQILGQLYEHDPKRARYLTEQHAWLMATEVLSIGIDFSFAPVLDLGKKISAVIGDRAFHTDPRIVTTLTKAYLQGMQQAGMAGTGKHFPGHGSVAADSHIDIPIDRRSYNAIAKEDLIPFAQCSADLVGIMPAHVIYPQVDKLPAGFSKLWLQNILRKQLGFSGAIFSDDLSMQGASQLGDMPTKARAALQAGCDMVLVCNDPDSAIQVLEDLEQRPFTRDTKASPRLRKMFGRPRLTYQELVETPRWQQAVRDLQQIT